MKNHTDLGQSKKLAEILQLEGADMYYSRDETTYAKTLTKYDITHANVLYGSCDIQYFNICEWTPAWSLAALMNLLPSEFTTENELGKYKYEIKIRKYKFTDNVDVHQIAYGNYKWHEDGSCSWKDMINTGEKEELLDAAFDMVCWLKENNKI